MPILLRTLTGEDFSLDLNGQTSVDTIKNLLKEKYNFLPENVSLIYQAQVLTDQSIVDTDSMKPNEFVVIHEKRQNLRAEKRHHIQSSIPPVLPIKPGTEYIPPYPKPSEPVSIPPQAPISSSKPGEHSSSKKHHRHHTKAPEIEEHPGFNNSIADLVEMGFERGQSIRIFRAVNYDIDAAIQALTTGELPSNMNDDSESENDSEYEEKTPIVVTPKNHGPRIRDVSTLNTYNFSIFRSQVDEMTNEQQYALLRILIKFPRRNTVETVQFFISCDKDYVITENLLNEMGE